MHANAHLTRRRHVCQQVTKCHCMCQYPQGSCCLLSGMTARVREPNCHTGSRDATKTRQDSGTSWHTSTEAPNDVRRRTYLTGLVVDLHVRPEGRGVAGEHRQVLHSDAKGTSKTLRYGAPREVRGTAKTSQYSLSSGPARAQRYCTRRMSPRSCELR